MLSLPLVLSVLKKYALLISTIFIVVVLLVAYLMGFRPGPGLTVIQVGTLAVTGIPDGTIVYTDQARRGQSVGGEMSIPLVPGTHSVIVDTAGDFPWNDVVTVAANTTTTVRPILVENPVVRAALTGKSAIDAQTLLDSVTPPTKDSPLTLAGGCANVYVSDNRIVAEAATSTCATPPAYLCSSGTCEPTQVFAPTNTISSVVAFPGRDDAIIVAFGNIYAVIEIDPRTPQFYAPLFRGISAAVAPWSAHSIIARNGKTTYEVTF